MRLARTTSPLPRESGRQESNLRSPAPEAGGVAVSPTARRCQWEERLASLNRGGALLERFPEPSVARQHACQPPSWTARGMPCPLSDAGCTLRPSLRSSVSRCSVTPLGSPSTAQSCSSTPGGSRTRSSGLRARRHSLRPQGQEAPAAGLEPALSRLTVARLTDSTTPERNGRRGSRTPKAFSRPTRFRDGVPRPWQSFPVVEQADGTVLITRPVGWSTASGRGGGGARLRRAGAGADQGSEWPRQGLNLQLPG
jgi:hypothetical protein